MNTSAVVKPGLAGAINAEHEAAHGKAREALEHARRCGELLLEAKRVAGHGGWMSWIETNCRFSERTARGYMQLASGWEQLQGKSATVADLGLRGALELLAESSEAPHTGGGMPYRGFSPEAYSVEWYTPAEYIAPARMALGAIDLDPASCAEANEIVRAKRFYTKDEDGLVRPWAGSVWLNPPYGSAAPKFAEKLVAEHAAGNVPAGIILLNAFSVTTQWFRPFWDRTLCFANKRVAFSQPGGEPGNAPSNGSVFVYIGPRPEAFARAFFDIGPVVRRWPEAAA